jgi:hypothetical protein
LNKNAQILRSSQKNKSFKKYEINLLYMTART